MSENWSVQVSLKTPAGTLINLRGEGPSQVESQLGWVTEHAPDIVKAERAVSGVATVAQSFPGAQVVQQDGPSWSQQGSQQQGGFAQQPPQDGPKCVHGSRVYKAGTSKAGKPYKMWACPSSNRQQQCDPEWVRD